MQGRLRTTARLFFGNCLPKIAYPVIVGPLRGAKFILGALAGKGGGATVYFNMLETEQTSAFAAVLKKEQVFFDVGANVGLYSILGSRLVGAGGKVIAFEPVVKNLAYLYRHTVLNRSQNVSIISAACSDTVSLSAFAAGPTSAEGHLLNGKTSADDFFLVPTLTVDAVAQKLGLMPDVIKIDVEGAELAVLLGARSTLQQGKPKIFLSTHSDELRLSCLNYLAGLGYAAEVLSLDKDNPSEFLMQHP